MTATGADNHAEQESAMRILEPGSFRDNGHRGFEHVPTEYQQAVEGGRFSACAYWIKDAGAAALVLHRSSDAWSKTLNQSPRVTRVEFFDQITGASLGATYGPRIAECDNGAGQRYDALAIPERYAEAANVVAIIHANLHTGQEVVLRTPTSDEETLPLSE